MVQRLLESGAVMGLNGEHIVVVVVGGFLSMVSGHDPGMCFHASPATIRASLSRFPVLSLLL